MLDEEVYYFYMYKIINLVNNKIYIGVHKTKDLFDGYMGSGVLLSKAMIKYGKTNFVKIILEFFNSSEEMYTKEREIVNEEFLKDTNTYNLKVGGNGGFDYIHKYNLCAHGKGGYKKGSCPLIGKPRPEFSGELHPFYGTTRQEHSILMSGENNPMYGKSHTEETKLKLSLINKGRKHPDDVNKRKGKKGDNNYFSKEKGIVSAYDIRIDSFVRIPRDEFLKYKGEFYFGVKSKKVKEIKMSKNVNEITGDRIVSKSSEDYRNNYDKIFRKEKPKSKPIIVSNKVQCKQCGDIIESKHRHDFVGCSCGKVMIDGGREYMRWLGNFEDFIDLSEVTSEDEEDWFEKVRETFLWTSYGINGDQPARKILLKDMEDSHIENILKTQYHIRGTSVEEWFKLELEYRGVNNG